MPLLSPQNNFADLQEQLTTLLKSTKDEQVKQLTGIVITLAHRCDELERQVERVARGEK